MYDLDDDFVLLFSPFFPTLRHVTYFNFFTINKPPLVHIATMR